MKKIFIIILFFAATGLYAQTTLKVKSGVVTFKIKNAGLNVDGSFTGFTGDIKFDEGKGGSIDASVDAATVKTGIDMRDEHLRKEEYFNVKKFPKISIKSTKITFVKGDEYTGDFDVTMKGVTKSVKIPFTYSAGVFKGSFKINRLDYKVGGSSWTLSDDANVSVTITTEK